MAPTEHAGVVKASDVPVDRRTVLSRDTVFVVYAIVSAISARFAFQQGSDIFPIAWVFFILCAPLFVLGERFVIVTVTAFFIFFESSLWFIGEDAPDTVYERDIFGGKAVEFLVIALAGRFFIHKHQLSLINRSIMVLLFLWFLVVVQGLLVSQINNVPLYNALIFSEVRSPALFTVFLVVMYNYIRREIRFFLKMFTLLMMAKIAITAISINFGVDILWTTHASGYVGAQTAFFGADPSVKVLLLAAAIAMFWYLRSAKTIAVPRLGARRDITDRPWFLGLCALVFVLVAIAALRRGGVLGMSIILISGIPFAGARMRVLLMGLILVSVAFVLFSFYGQTGLLPEFAQSALERLMGVDESVAQSDWGRKMDIVQGWEVIYQHPILGHGAGTKLALARVATYGKSESLTIHQNLTHMWVKFGILGVTTYLLTFVIPLAAFWRSRKLVREKCAPWLVAGAFAGASFLVAEFAWSLATPPFTMNFRTCAIVSFAIILIYAAINDARRIVTRPAAGPARKRDVNHGFASGAH